MKSKTKKHLLIGLSLILIAFFCILGMVYLIGKVSLEKEEKIASLEVELTNFISTKGQEALPPEDAQLVKRDLMNLDDYLAKAEKMYGPKEVARRQGVLWVDRKASQYLVTLGRTQGLKKGSRLSIYEKDNKIGQLDVEASLDIISYTQPVGMTMSDFSKDYYRVVIEDFPNP